MKLYGDAKEIMLVIVIVSIIFRQIYDRRAQEKAVIFNSIP